MKQTHMLFGGLVAMLYGGIKLALFSVHVVTTYYAWEISNSISVTLLTFFLPPFSEFWWAFTAWMKTGNFLNLFTLMIISVISLYVIQAILVAIFISTESKSKKSSV